MRKNLHIIAAAFIFSVLLWGSISLSNDYYATVEIPLRLVNFPDGYTSGTRVPEKLSVKLKGEGWKLVTVNLGSNPEFNVSVGNDSGRKFINLYNYLVENQWLSSDIEVIDISPDTVSFFVEKVISKRVKIIPELNIEFKPGYGLAREVKLMPDTTTVFGPQSILKNLNEIRTEQLKLEKVDEKVQEVVSINELPGMSYADRSVNIILDVQKIVDREFSDLNIKIDDVPRDRNVVLLPNKITIGVRGGIDILGKLKEDDFEAHLNYRDIVLDTLGSVKPVVQMPDNTRLLYLKPERLRYVIKKFN